MRRVPGIRQPTSHAVAHLAVYCEDSFVCLDGRESSSGMIVERYVARIEDSRIGVPTTRKKVGDGYSIDPYGDRLYSGF